MNRKAHVACNFNCLFENGLLEVTASHVQCGSISETVPDRVIVTNADH